MNHSTLLLIGLSLMLNACQSLPSSQIEPSESPIAATEPQQPTETPNPAPSVVSASNPPLCIQPEGLNAPHIQSITLDYQTRAQTLIDLVLAGEAPYAVVLENQQPKSLLNGLVYDVDGHLIQDAQASVRSLNPSIPYQKTAVLVNGRYILSDAPAGVQLEVSVSKTGFTTRIIQVVLQENPFGDVELNRYDFGYADPDFTHAFNGLNSLPEVTQAWFLRDHPNVRVKGLGLRFSEPVNRRETEHNLGLYYASETNQKDPSKIFLDYPDFDFSWSDQDQKLEIRFSEKAIEPEDLEKTYWSFGRGSDVLQDAQGEQRDELFFKLDGSEGISFLPYNLIGPTQQAEKLLPEPVLYPVDPERLSVEAIPEAPKPGLLPDSEAQRLSLSFQAADSLLQARTSQNEAQNESVTAFLKSLNTQHWPEDMPDLNLFFQASGLSFRDLPLQMGNQDLRLNLALHKQRAAENGLVDQIFLGLKLSPARCLSDTFAQSEIQIQSLTLELPGWLYELDAKSHKLSSEIFVPFQANQVDFQGQERLKLDLNYRLNQESKSLSLDFSLEDLLQMEAPELQAAWQVWLMRAVWDSKLQQQRFPFSAVKAEIQAEK